mgnify:FL=1
METGAIDAINAEVQDTRHLNVENPQKEDETEAIQMIVDMTDEDEANIIIGKSINLKKKITF